MAESDVLRDARARSRETRTTTWTLVYGGVLLVAMICAMALAVVHEAAGSLTAGASWLPYAVALAWSAGLLVACLTFGPAHAPPATAVWLLPSPIDRVSLLRRALAVTLVLAAALGALGGLTTALVSGAEDKVVALVPLGGLVGVALHQLALRAQARGSVRVVRTGAALTAAAVALVITSGRRPGMTWGIASFAPWVAGAAAIVAAAVILVSLFRWPTWLRRVSAPSLRAAGEVVDTAMRGAVMLDPSAFAVRDARRAGRRRGRATSVGVVRFRHGSAVLDFVARDAVAALRRGGTLLAKASWMLGVWAFGAIFAPAFGHRPSVVVAAVVVWGAVAAAGQGLATWLGSSSLWRLVPTRPQAVTAALAVTPLVVGWIVATAALAGAGVGAADALAWGVLLSAASAAGVARRTDPPPVKFGNAVSTPMGDLELGLTAALLHGPDVVALCLVIGMIAGPYAGCLAAVGWMFRVVVTAKPGGKRR